MPKAETPTPEPVPAGSRREPRGWLHRCSLVDRLRRNFPAEAGWAEPGEILVLFASLHIQVLKIFFTLSQFLLVQHILRLVLCLQGHSISLNPRLVFQSELKYSWSTLFVICSKLVQLFQIITFSELLI